MEAIAECLLGRPDGYVYVTGGQVNDVKLLDQLVWEAGAFYLLDRATSITGACI
jgi:hypothetical protein